MPFVPVSPVLDAPSHADRATTTAGSRITAPVLVAATWLHQHASDVRIIDTRPLHEFTAGHIAGAIALPLDALLIDDSSRPGLERLGHAAQQVLAARGIAPTDHVVLVDDGDGSAALGAMICELAGLRRVTVVHGSGIQTWAAAGGSLAAGAPEPMSADAATRDVTSWPDTPLRTSTIAAFEDLVDAVVEGTARIIDARSQLEHEGIVGSPCCAGRGAIPGSVHLEWTELLDISGAPCSPARARDVVAHVGIDPDAPLIITCHAGHRAAVAARVLRSVGFRDVRVSIGSWHEWSCRGLGEDEAETTANEAPTEA